MQQESPSTWTQETHCPPCSKCSLCWWGRGYPIQSWTGGYNHQVLTREVHPLSWSWMGVPPLKSNCSHLILLCSYNCFAIIHWIQPLPSERHGGTPHPDLGWSTPCLDLGWGTPPHPDLGWSTLQSRPGMGYPPSTGWDTCHPDLGWGTLSPLVWTDWKYYLPSSFGCGW